MVDDINIYRSAGEFSVFFCSCLHMVDGTKSCMVDSTKSCMVDSTKSCIGDLLVWNLLRLSPTSQP